MRLSSLFFWFLAHISLPTAADYTATKAALLQLHESLRFELDSQSIPIFIYLFSSFPANMAPEITLRYNAPKILTSLVIPSVIHTRLFSTSTLTKSRVFRFFSPELEPHQVVKRMIAVLGGAEGETIMMPKWVDRPSRDGSRGD